ncbi:hypothetical protein FRUB_07201 [Fimbriiglobus ruber]|uniref:FtsH ternary system domain-containing protein n=1 Tax=Fimbriiglobus ruber TaxID=1908690 RepID=A0A225D945_9BACT|nr:hypothetical protein FRUB_07201 [Fimbriiglobus ruber]
MKETLDRELKGADEICTHLELLEVLPPEQMAELLKGELKGRGFEENADGVMTRKDGALTVTVDPCNGEVSVKSEVQENITLEAKREATGYDDIGPSSTGVRERVREQLKQDLEKKAEKETERLQTEATKALEQHLEELQPELSQVVNKVTRDALKQKAAQLGTITEIAEDAETGSLTIKVEV